MLAEGSGGEAVEERRNPSGSEGSGGSQSISRASTRKEGRGVGPAGTTPGLVTALSSGAENGATDAAVGVGVGAGKTTGAPEVDAKPKQVATSSRRSSWTRRWSSVASTGSFSKESAGATGQDKGRFSFLKAAASLGFEDAGPFLEPRSYGLCGTPWDDPMLTVKWRAKPSTMQALLRGDLPAPWKPVFFAEFADEQYCGEAVRFWCEVEALKRGPESVEPTLLVVPAELHADATKWARAIIDTFVRPGAPSECNVSDPMRQEALRRAALLFQDQEDGDPEARRHNTAGVTEFQLTDAGANGTSDQHELRAAFADVFAPMQAEAEKLLREGVFQGFARRVLTENVSTKEMERRLVEAFVALLLSLALTALLLGFFVPRWWLFAVLPLWAWCTSAYLTAKARLCLKATSTNTAYIGLHRVPVHCPVARMSTRARAKRLMLRIAVASIVLTLIGLSLTWIIEAALGRNVYAVR